MHASIIPGKREQIGNERVHVPYLSMHLVDDLHIGTAEGEQGITAWRFWPGYLSPRQGSRSFWPGTRKGIPVPQTGFHYICAHLLCSRYAPGSHSGGREWLKCPFEHVHICLQEGEWRTQYMGGVSHKLLLLFICPLDRDQSTHGKKACCQSRDAYAQSAAHQQHQQQARELAITSRQRDIDLDHTDRLPCMIKHRRRHKTKMHSMERDFTYIGRSCCQRLLQRPLVRKSWKQVGCPLVDASLGIDEQEKRLERGRAERTGRIDHQLATL